MNSFIGFSIFLGAELRTVATPTSTAIIWFVFFDFVLEANPKKEVKS